MWQERLWGTAADPEWLSGGLADVMALCYPDMHFAQPSICHRILSSKLGRPTIG